MYKSLFPVPSKKALKKLGYLNDQKGIVNRYLVEDGWKKHVKRTHKFIINSLKDLDFNTVSILGSGWLLDVPIEFLLEKFEKIYCFDINHPEQIKHKYRKEPKLEFVEGDITGGLIEQLYLSKDLKINDTPAIRTNEMDGCFISLNLMSQLDNLLFEYSGIKKVDEKQLRKKIQENHLQFISHFPYLLITDYEEVYLDEAGNTISKKPTVHIRLPQSQKIEKWTWAFDTHKTYKNDCHTDLRVIAINKLIKE